MIRHRAAQNQMSSKPPVKLKIGFLLAKNFTLNAFSLFVDTLRLGSDQGDNSGRIACDWSVMSSTNHFITSSSGVQVVPTTLLKPATDFTYLVVVGGRLNEDEVLDGEVLRYLKTAFESNVPIIGLCTGSFVLASAGVLRGKRACVSWLHHREFREKFPEISVSSHELFVEDGNVITCAGGSSAADLAAFLLNRHIGEYAERNALEILQISRRRDAKEMQTRNPLGRAADDKRVELALLIMEQHVEDLLEIEDIAAQTGLSRRQLERSFRARLGVSPSAAYLTMRLDSANRLVRTTSVSLSEVAVMTGFENSSHFIRKFRERFGSPPATVRKMLKLGNQAIQQPVSALTSAEDDY
ncbi:GlxA family transcriptional regulator [Rhizobium sp. S163]|uniref:GlxA family transcriptional regulator n=1 Tax=Rhizobium sp. S163 TaxID=3055039 RepID=UPI0025A93BC6|nr:GlxA family transcriptional regulator [Rhizobium sp. S163]MDM9649180.1 GlxA family transcriptional regulator [Rhizobium sp. S163]